MKHPRHREEPRNALDIIRGHLDDRPLPHPFALSAGPGGPEAEHATAHGLPLTSRGAYIDPAVFAEPFAPEDPYDPAEDAVFGFPFDNDGDDAPQPAHEEDAQPTEEGAYLVLFGAPGSGRQVPARRGKHDEPVCAREAPRFGMPDSVVAARKAAAAARARQTRAANRATSGIGTYWR